MLLNAISASPVSSPLFPWPVEEPVKLKHEYKSRGTTYSHSSLLTTRCLSKIVASLTEWKLNYPQNTYCLESCSTNGVVSILLKQETASAGGSTSFTILCSGV